MTSTLNRWRCMGCILTVATGLVVEAHAQHASQPILDTQALSHVALALDLLNMTPGDLGFDKDVGRPTNALGYVREMLSEPLRLPQMGDSLIAVAAVPDNADWWAKGAELLELTNGLPTPAAVQAALPGNRLADDCRAAIHPFLEAAASAGEMLRSAGCSREERMYVVAASLWGALHLARPGPRTGFMDQTGIDAETVKIVEAENDNIDPKFGALHYLHCVNQTDSAKILAAGRVIERAAISLLAAAAEVEHWPEERRTLSTDLGTIVIGTQEDDVYDDVALLILDPGGDDEYRGLVGTANGLLDRPVAVIVDLVGNDRYISDDTFGAGFACWGVACVLDAAGDDSYVSAGLGQASAVFASATLIDREGDDRYQALVHAQSSADVGMARLEDHAGNDLYEVGSRGQAYAGVKSVALLVDRAGQDRYIAGRVEPDSERHKEHFLSLAQGFAIGSRPFLGGGVAALIDMGGNDNYDADVYGQGVSYWYSVGMLLDLGGHDRYSLHEYGQGSGIHLSHGLLLDAGGNDLYYGHSLSQGNAHDYAVGMLFDQGGDDTYVADHYSQGRAINNAFGLLLDSSGRDGYFGRVPASCQGVGHLSSRREYGSISLLIDLGDRDIYSCAATNGAVLVRPNDGVVYDWAPPEEDAK